MLFYVGSAILAVLGMYCWLGTKKAYDKGEILPLRVSIAFWSLDMVHASLVVVSALYSVWPLPFNKTAALIGGLAMFGAGLAFMLAGMAKFRSLQKISGLDASELVTSGIYQLSRNPQYFGWFLVLSGISLIGSSGLALLYTGIAIILFHSYITRMEEPYLEHVFGEKYLLYKGRTPRYFGILKSKESKFNTLSSQKR